MVLIAIAVLFTVSPVKAEWFSHEFDVMGTRAKVEFEHNSAPQAKKLIQQVVDEMNRIDHLMSPFKPDSELSKINRLAAKSALVISGEMFSLLEQSLHYSHLTKGAFDITFSSVGYLYDFRNKIKPNKREKEGLVASIDFRSIRLDKVTKTIKFNNLKTKIDLGGIAKGHAVDQCIALLRLQGIKNAFVSAGGDSRVIGKKNDRLWYIGIKHPRDKNKLVVNLPLEEVAISTSGDYERFFIQDGVRYHHIIDPKTGDSARSSQSVTILADTSTDADALSTSIFVLGPVRGMDLVNQLPNISAIIIDKNGKMTFSDDLTNAK